MADVPVAEDLCVAVGGCGYRGTAAFEINAGSHGDLAAVGEDFNSLAVDDDGKGVGVALSKRGDSGF